MRKLGTLSAAVLATVLMAAPVSASSDAGAISQYLVSMASRDRQKAANPTPYEMFVLWIQHNDDGTFSGCESTLLSPREADNDGEVLDGIGDGTRGTHEVLAVPTEGPYEGKIAKAKASIGVWARSHSNTMTARDPKTFELNEVTGEADDLVTCACDELDDEGQDDDLLEAFGIVCP